MDAIKVGLIGYGMAGSIFHAPLICSVSGLQLMAVSTSRVEQVQRDIPGAKVVAHPEAIFSNPEIELVVIASPTSTHFDLACAALRAGKNLVVDKPFTTTVQEADRLLELAKAQHCLLSVFQNRRWENGFLTLRRCIEQGLLGEIYYYESHYDRFRPAIKQGWREKSLPGSGILYDLGSHLIDQALLLFGLPQSVTADVITQRAQGKVDDYFHLILGYGRKRVILHSATLVRAPGPRLMAHGDGGSFLKYGEDGQEAALKAGRKPDSADWGRDVPEHYAVLTASDGISRAIESLPGAYQKYYENVIPWIRGRGPAPVDPADARNGILVIEASLSSARERRTVDLDRFV
jgi:scyllo-inositol 2-dehydrogenase (NADP+)